VNRTIPGNLTLDALKALHGHRETNRDADRLQHFERLTQPEREQAIRHMAAEGYSDTQIAHATRLAVEQVRRVLSQPSSADHADIVSP
jgi:DNA-binding NarL/FixJ family response regulator